jgi:hypothetical protein
LSVALAAKVSAVFFRRGDVLDSGQGIDANGVGSGGGAEVAQLALAGGGGIKAKGHGKV